MLKNHFTWKTGSAAEKKKSIFFNVKGKKKKKKRLGAIPSLLPIPVMTIFAWWFLEKEFDKNYLFLQQAVSLDTESSQQQNVLKLPLRLSQKHLLQADRDSYPVISWKKTDPGKHQKDSSSTSTQRPETLQWQIQKGNNFVDLYKIF